MSYIIAATGSRSFDDLSLDRQVEIYMDLDIYLASLKKAHPDLVGMSGCAEGWDDVTAWRFSTLDIPWIAAIPHKGYGKYYWGEHSRTGKDRYADFDERLAQAKEIVYVCDSVYVNGVHSNFVRNQYMVDHANEFVVYNPTKKGGTADCLRRIEKAKLPWKEFAATTTLKERNS